MTFEARQKNRRGLCLVHLLSKVSTQFFRTDALIGSSGQIKPDFSGCTKHLDTSYLHVHTTTLKVTCVPCLSCTHAKMLPSLFPELPLMWPAGHRLFMATCLIPSWLQNSTTVAHFCVFQTRLGKYEGYHFCSGSFGHLFTLMR